MQEKDMQKWVNRNCKFSQAAPVQQAPVKPSVQNTLNQHQQEWNNVGVPGQNVGQGSTNPSELDQMVYKTYGPPGTKVNDSQAAQIIQIYKQHGVGFRDMVLGQQGNWTIDS